MQNETVEVPKTAVPPTAPEGLVQNRVNPHNFANVQLYSIKVCLQTTLAPVDSSLLHKICKSENSSSFLTSLCVEILNLEVSLHHTHTVHEYRLVTKLPSVNYSNKHFFFYSL